MIIQTAVLINAPVADIWNRITDIEHAGEIISAIDTIEVIEKPASGFTGFTWKETRTMFGKEATEVMEVTEVRENEYYITRAASHGSVYITTVAIRETAEGNELSMALNSEPQTAGGKIMTFIFGFLFKGATRKAIFQDLLDIKNFLEEKT